MNKNIFAYTEESPIYPGYISVNQNDEGNIEITIRESPTTIDGISVCGIDCIPGTKNCNNYCARIPNTPISERANPKTHTRAGVTTTLTVSPEIWEMMKQSQLLKYDIPEVNQIVIDQ